MKLAASYGGNWRDIVVFICAILFTIIWWNVSHSRSNWLIMFIVMIILSVIAAIYAARGIARAIADFHALARSTAEDSVVIGVRRRRDVGGLVDVVELRRLDAVRAGQIEDLVRAGDARQV